MATGNCDPVRNREVSTVMERLNCDINRLDEIVSQVEATFSAVTSPAAPQVSGSDDGECSSVHAETIRQYCARTENLIAALEGIISRCEL